MEQVLEKCVGTDAHIDPDGVVIEGDYPEIIILEENSEDAQTAFVKIAISREKLKELLQGVDVDVILKAVGVDVILSEIPSEKATEFWKIGELFCEDMDDEDIASLLGDRLRLIVETDAAMCDDIANDWFDVNTYIENYIEDNDLITKDDVMDYVTASSAIEHFGYRDFLYHIDVDDVVDYFDTDSILDEIGKDAVLEYFSLEDDAPRSDEI